MAYLQWMELADYCAIPPEWLLEAGEGFLDVQISIFESKLNDQLRNRYQVPFTAPNPTVKGWIAKQVTEQVLLRRGVDPNDVMFTTHKGHADLARQEIGAAADSDVGLFELPLLVSTTPVSRGFRGISDADPSAFKARQGERARAERDERNYGIVRSRRG